MIDILYVVVSVFVLYFNEFDSIRVILVIILHFHVPDHAKTSKIYFSILKQAVLDLTENNSNIHCIMAIMKFYLHALKVHILNIRRYDTSVLLCSLKSAFLYFLNVFVIDLFIDLRIFQMQGNLFEELSWVEFWLGLLWLFFLKKLRLKIGLLDNFQLFQELKILLLIFHVSV